MKPQLIASCWTSAGDAAPDRDDLSSPVAIDERIALVAETGWAGIGLVHADLIKARDTIGYEELRRRIHAAGIEIIEVEFLNGWWATGAERQESDAVRADLFAAAQALGSPHIKVGAGEGTNGVIPIAHMASAFTDLAAEAEAHGVKLALEATPFSHLKTIYDALEVVSHSDSPSAGLMVDIWHTAKIGIPNDELWRNIPLSKVNAVEVDDGFIDTPIDLFDDSTNRRAYCGEGEFDPASFIRGAIDAGWTGAYGVEIISAEHRSLPVKEGLQRAFDTTIAAFEQAARLAPSTN
ncbi:sugar phosphate isomerase/epimerase family protein [Corynebacterium glutamicum]|uniref:sugar phosphate isomerase/epimerase family protein n=1 Tax=Corynebacterium glutamicum TaxID=1718 RepID=UPI000259B9B1|nr:sugar phosphate isomerase/epimerase [Corynebacterium glutamicum]CCH26176.1 hypothetical protein WA5_2956 [Corynebacterium glutamicum K051]